MSRKRIRGFDASKIPWTPIIIGVVVIYVLPKLKDLVPDLHNPFIPPDDVLAAANSELWSGSYGQGQSYHGLTAASAKAAATFIHDAYGWFSVNWSGIIAKFKQLQYKTQLTDLIVAFQNQYNEDLYTYITSGVAKGNSSPDGRIMQSTVIAYVNSLPSGIV